MVRKAFCALTLLVSSLAAAAPKPNIVLITMSSARADRMGFLGAKGVSTPNLDRLAADSLVFERAYAQAPSTLVSHATLLSGLYPQATGFTDLGGVLPTSLPYLADLLRGQGYRTAAFVGSIELDPKNGPAQGFSRGFQAYSGLTASTQGIGSRPGAQVVTQAAAWVGQNTQGPYFVWVQVSDPDAASTASYNAAIAATDAAIGKFLATLKQQKAYSNTTILVAGDHGQSLGAHGEDSHGIFLYEETIHVPLLLKVPDAQSASKRVATRVRLVDIAPTLLEIAGVPVPSQMQGQSLLRMARAASGADQPVYSRSDLPQRGFGWSAIESWRAGKYLYIRAPKPELYDLTTDSGATKNLAQSSKATVDTLASQLENFSRRISGEGGKAGAGQLSSSEMQKLASLGYVGLQKAGGASAATGTDAKDKIATAVKVVDAARALEQGKTDRALSVLTPLVAAEQGLYLAEYALGAAQVQKGQAAEGVKHLHKAIELQPDSAWAHYWMGVGLLKTGDYKTSAVHLEIAAERLPGFAGAQKALGEARHHGGAAASK